MMRDYITHVTEAASLWGGGEGVPPLLLLLLLLLQHLAVLSQSTRPALFVPCAMSVSDGLPLQHSRHECVRMTKKKEKKGQLTAGNKLHHI